MSSRDANPKGSKEARRNVALLLEALCGMRSTTEAAEAMGVSMQRYYVLERRAVQGMVTALEPRRQGRQVTLEAQVTKLEGEIERLSGELMRYQTLHRASQRVIGVPREEPSPASSTRRKRKTTRARRKSRAEKLVPRVSPAGVEKRSSEESPPTGRAASDAVTARGEDV